MGVRTEWLPSVSENDYRFSGQFGDRQTEREKQWEDDETHFYYVVMLQTRRADGRDGLEHLEAAETHCEPYVTISVTETLGGHKVELELPMGTELSIVLSS
jgi:hypothetical protein